MAISKNRKLFLIALIIIGVLIARTAVPWERFGDQKARAQEIKASSDPSILVGNYFLDALRENNLKLAKELVTPEQQDRIDKWKRESHHQAFDCPTDWKYIFSDPFQIIASGGTGETEIDDTTLEIDSSYACINNNREMRIEKVIVKFDGSIWVITDWEMICEIGQSEDAKEVCYQ